MTNVPRAVLVVSGCSATKRLPPVTSDFDVLADVTSRHELLERHAKQLLPARDLYDGWHHRTVVRAIDSWREAQQATRIDLAIVSAGYGVLDEHDLVASYDVTFRGLGRRAIASRGEALGIGASLRRRIRDYDAAVILLSSEYLQAIGSPLRSSGQEVYFAGSQSCLGDDVLRVNCGIDVARSLRAAGLHCRAVLFQRFAATAIQSGWRTALDEALSGRLAQGAPGSRQLELV